MEQMGNGKEKEIKMPGWRGTEAPLAYLFHYKSSRLFRWTRFSRRIKKFGSRSGMISPLNFPVARKIGGNRAAIYLSKMKISKRCSTFSKRSSCCYSTRYFALATSAAQSLGYFPEAEATTGQSASELAVERKIKSPTYVSRRTKG